MSNQQRNVVLNASDIFIMPNIKVDGDIEGFGIVMLEAGSVGLPVIASTASLVDGSGRPTGR